MWTRSHCALWMNQCHESLKSSTWYKIHAQWIHVWPIKLKDTCSSTSSPSYFFHSSRPLSLDKSHDTAVSGCWPPAAPLFLSPFLSLCLRASHSSSPMTTSERLSLSPLLSSSPPRPILLTDERERQQKTVASDTQTAKYSVSLPLSRLIVSRIPLRVERDKRIRCTQLLSRLLLPSSSSFSFLLSGLLLLTIAFVDPINRSPVNDIFHCFSCDLMPLMLLLFFYSVRVACLLTCSLAFTVTFCFVAHLQE